MSRGATRRTRNVALIRACLTLALALGATPAFGEAPRAEIPDEASLMAQALAWDLEAADAGLAASSSIPAEARALIEATIAFRRADFKAAIAKLRPVIKRRPDAHRARVLLGRALAATGQDREAHRVLDFLADAYNADRLSSGEDLLQLGISLQLNGFFKSANRAFREALAASPRNLEARIAWAELFYTKYAQDEAKRLLDEVDRQLGGAKPPVDAAILKARLLLELGNATEAQAISETIVANHPECVPAHNLIARIALEAERPEDSVARLREHALRVAPNDPEALGLLAAAYRVLDDEASYAAVEKQALKVNRKNTLFYELVANQMERIHRYADAIRIAERGLKLDKGDARLLTIVALGYARSGDDARARKALDAAHKEDPYNVRVFNFLAHFFDDADKKFRWIEGDGFRIRADRDEADVIALHVPRLAREALDHLERKYATKAAPPLHIEIFADPETFAIRSIGKPRLAAHGICFGHVITARSPSQGGFNWGDVIWHELAHVFHLQTSQNRVPRWFTEGLALLESTDSRGAWAREMAVTFAQSKARTSPRGVSEFNLAFTQAKSVEEIVLAYYRAYQMLRFIRETFGTEITTEMLRAWGRKLKTPEVFATVLKLPPKEFDARFEAWLDKEFAWVEIAYPFQMAMQRSEFAEALARAAAPAVTAEERARGALAALKTGDTARALTLAESVDPATTSPNHAAMAGLVQAKALIATERLDEALAILDALAAKDLGGVPVLEELASLAVRRADKDRLKSALERATQRDPERLEFPRRLAVAAEEAGNTVEALAWWEHVLAIDETGHDAAAHILRLLPEDLGARPRASRAVEMIQFSRLFDPRLQETIVAAATRLGLTEQAELARKTRDALVAR